MTINVLLVENNMDYGRQLINILARKNKDFRLCGITNEREEVIFILNNICIDVILIDVPLNEFSEIIDLMDTKKSVIVLLDEKSESQKSNYFLKNRSINYIVKSNSIMEDVNNINPLFISKNTIQFCKLSENEKLKVLKKITKELNTLGYNLELLGSKYLVEIIYILYVAIDYYNYNFEKDIYPIIAKKYGKSVNNIKTNIKNANEIMYFDNEEKKIMNYLETQRKTKPHTKQIVKAVLKKISFSSKSFNE